MGGRDSTPITGSFEAFLTCGQPVKSFASNLGGKPLTVVAMTELFIYATPDGQLEVVTVSPGLS